MIRAGRSALMQLSKHSTSTAAVGIERTAHGIAIPSALIVAHRLNVGTKRPLVQRSIRSPVLIPRAPPPSDRCQGRPAPSSSSRRLHPGTARDRTVSVWRARVRVGPLERASIQRGSAESGSVTFARRGYSRAKKPRQASQAGRQHSMTRRRTESGGVGAIATSWNSPSVPATRGLTLPQWGG